MKFITRTYLQYTADTNSDFGKSWVVALTQVSLPIWPGTSPLLISIFSSRLWYHLFYQCRLTWHYAGTKDQEQNLTCLHSWWFDSLPEDLCLYQLLTMKSASCDCSGKFCSKIWHHLQPCLCRSLWFDNLQLGEHPLWDYCLGCRFISGVWCTLPYLDFIMSDGRKNRWCLWGPVSVYLSNIILEECKESCISAKCDTRLTVPKSEWSTKEQSKTKY